MTAKIHLHWAWDRPNAVRLLSGVSIGFALCGERVGRDQLSKWVEDATCLKCRGQGANSEPPPKGRVSPDRPSQRVATAVKIVAKKQRSFILKEKEK